MKEVPAERYGEFTIFLNNIASDPSQEVIECLKTLDSYYSELIAQHWFESLLVSMARAQTRDHLGQLSKNHLGQLSKNKDLLRLAIALLDDARLHTVADENEETLFCGLYKDQKNSDVASLQSICIQNAFLAHDKESFAALSKMCQQIDASGNSYYGLYDIAIAKRCSQPLLKMLQPIIKLSPSSYRAKESLAEAIKSGNCAAAAFLLEDVKVPITAYEQSLIRRYCKEGDEMHQLCEENTFYDVQESLD